MRKIGELIRTLRINKGWTQAELASKLDITDKAVGKWEQGLGDPDLQMIIPLARLFSITTDELLSGELKDIKTDLSKSLYERVILSGIDNLEFFLNQGVNLLGKDEFDKTIIDYIYQYQSNDFLNYAIKHHWLKTVPFKFTERRRSRIYSHEYVEHSGKIYVRNSVFESLKQSFPHLRLSDDSAVMKLSDSSGLQHPFLDNNKMAFEHDLLETLSIIMASEDLDLLKEMGYYRFFLTNDRQQKVFSAYVKNTSFDESFFDELMTHQDILLSRLTHMAVLENNATLLDKLLPICQKKEIHFSKTQLDDLIKYNHQDIDALLLTELNLRDIDIKTVYQYNKHLYKLLPSAYLDEHYKALTGLIDPSDLKSIDILFIDPNALIKENKLELLSKHLEAVKLKNKVIEDFMDELVTARINQKDTFKLNEKQLNTFNQLFNKYFKYKPASIRTEDEFGAILRPERLKKIEAFDETLKDHRRLENVIIKSSGDVKQTIYRVIEFTYSTSFEFDKKTLTDDLLLTAMPYLERNIKDLLLNNYNRDNQAVLKAFLQHGARFKQHKAHVNNSLDYVKTISYDQTEMRSSQTIKYEQLKDEDTYDMVKTMQFKMLLGVK